MDFPTFRVAASAAAVNQNSFVRPHPSCRFTLIIIILNKDGKHYNLYHIEEKNICLSWQHFFSLRLILNLKWFVINLNFNLNKLFGNLLLMFCWNKYLSDVYFLKFMTSPPLPLLNWLFSSNRNFLVYLYLQRDSVNLW